MDNLEKEINRKKKILDNYAPFSKEVVDQMNTLNKIEIAYNNLLLDGEKVTREDVVTVLIENGYRLIKPPTKRIKINNYGSVYKFFNGKLKKYKKYQNNISSSDILKMHKLLLNKINSLNAGKYRDIDIRIKEAKFEIPIADSIPELMNNYIEWMAKAAKSESPIKWAADAHFKLIEILPFIDANSRVARQIMNLILLENNYPPIITKPANKKVYLDTIRKAQQSKNMSAYYDMIYKLINKSLDLHLDFL